MAVVGEALGLKELRVVHRRRRLRAGARAVGDDGNDVVALQPGFVLAYNRNEWTHTRLRRAGVTVMEIDGSELGRSRGGHCMTCPLFNSTVDTVQ